MNLNTDEMRVGASAVARRETVSVQKIVADLVAANPGVERKRLFELFQELVGEDEAAQRAANHYTFTNFYDRVTAPVRPPQSMAERVAAFQEREKRKEAIKAEVVGRLLRMEWIVPSTGKRLMESTFGELAKLGGWFLKVSKRGKPNQIVGKVLTEADLQAIK